MQADSPTLLGFADVVRYLTTGGVLAACGLLYRLDRSMVKVNARIDAMRVTLVGESGQNGLNGEVKGLRKRMHDAENGIHALRGRTELHEQRLNRVDPEGAI